jgi:hypothetical protein
VIARLYKALGSPDARHVLLAHAAGISVRSTAIDDRLLRWSGELAGDLGIPCPVDESSSSEALESVFAQLPSRLAALLRVILLVDALDHVRTPEMRNVRSETGTRTVVCASTNRDLVSVPSRADLRSRRGRGHETRAKRRRFGRARLPEITHVDLDPEPLFQKDTAGRILSRIKGFLRDLGRPRRKVSKKNQKSALSRSSSRSSLRIRR